MQVLGYQPSEILHCLVPVLKYCWVFHLSYPLQHSYSGGLYSSHHSSQLVLNWWKSSLSIFSFQTKWIRRALDHKYTPWLVMLVVLWRQSRYSINYCSSCVWLFWTCWAHTTKPFMSEESITQIHIILFLSLKYLLMHNLTNNLNKTSMR